MLSNGVALLVLSLLAATFPKTTTVQSAQAVLWPSHSQARYEMSDIVRCSVEPPEPLAGCTFRVWAVKAARDGPLMDVKAGSKYSLTVAHPGSENDTLNVELQGVEFAKGRCSITINGLKGVDVLIGCKITTESKDTASNTMSVFFDRERRFELDSNNKQLSVEPGGKAEVSLQAHNAGIKLRRCATTMRSGVRVAVWPGSDGDFNVVESVPPSNRYAALGSDRMDRGRCGFRIANVTSADAGVVYVRAEAVGGALVAAQALVIVDRALQTDLTLDKPEYSVGDNLTATCTVYGLPRAQATALWWVERHLFSRADPADFEVGWSWPWQGVALSHRVTFVLKETAKAPCLRCKIGSTESKNACAQWRVTDSTTLLPTEESSRTTTAEVVTRTSTAEVVTRTSTTEVVTRTSTTEVLISTSMPEGLSTTAVDNLTHSNFAGRAPNDTGLRPGGDDDSNWLIASSSGGHTSALVVCNFILMVVVVLAASTATVYARVKRRWCFKDAAATQNRRNSVDTIYEEIPLDYLRALQPPCIPPLPKGWDGTGAIPKELAPPAPGVSNPEYMIIREDTKDKCEDGGYLEPRYHKMK